MFAKISESVQAKLIDGGWLLACTLSNLWRAASMWLSALFTVSWDPLGRSEHAIPLLGSRRRIGQSTAFTLQCEKAKNQRIVSWFYRWYLEPTPADWVECCARFDLKAPPDHMAITVGGDRVRVLVQIKSVNGGYPPFGITCNFYTVTLITVSRPYPTRGGLCGLGDLTPASLVNREAWDELARPRVEDATDQRAKLHITG
jgi:hypothetical protein